jgi:hypothetical protein
MFIAAAPTIAKMWTDPKYPFTVSPTQWDIAQPHKERSTDPDCDVDTPWTRHADGNKPDPKDHPVGSHPCKKSRVDQSADTERGLVVSRS